MPEKPPCFLFRIRWSPLYQAERRLPHRTDKTGKKPGGYALPWGESIPRTRTAHSLRSRGALAD
jgi:hypothetical protein